MLLVIFKNKKKLFYVFLLDRCSCFIATFCLIVKSNYLTPTMLPIIHSLPRSLSFPPLSFPGKKNKNNTQANSLLYILFNCLSSFCLAELLARRIDTLEAEFPPCQRRQVMLEIKFRAIFWTTWLHISSYIKKKPDHFSY